ncbi:MAG: hypothetical protein IPP32_12815 [Bacteroidetes bacterium]|nr:hypothetical protein [Bacteroidota bacterium]
MTQFASTFNFYAHPLSIPEIGRLQILQEKFSGTTFLSKESLAGISPEKYAVIKAIQASQKINPLGAATVEKIKPFTVEDFLIWGLIIGGVIVIFIVANQIYDSRNKKEEVLDFSKFKLRNTEIIPEQRESYDNTNENTIRMSEVLDAEEND